MIVDPIIAETRLTKEVMDGGSGLNILYAETLDLMGISKSRLRNDTSPFHGVVPGHRAHPLGQIDLPVYFGTPDNFRWEVLTFMWSGSQELTTRSWGDHATPSSWSSPTTPTSSSRCRGQTASSPSARQASTPTSATSSASSRPRLWLSLCRSSPASATVTRTSPTPSVTPGASSWRRRPCSSSSTPGPLRAGR